MASLVYNILDEGFYTFFRLFLPSSYKTDKGYPKQDIQKYYPKDMTDRISGWLLLR